MTEAHARRCRWENISRALALVPLRRTSWLANGESLFDCFGTGFTLLKLDSAADTSALEAAAAARSVPLKVITPDAEALTDLCGTKLALVRPDHHIAWRGDAVPDDPEALIDTVRGA